jgi:hypothetical protein
VTPTATLPAAFATASVLCPSENRSCVSDQLRHGHAGHERAGHVDRERAPREDRQQAVLDEAVEALAGQRARGAERCHFRQ